MPKLLSHYTEMARRDVADDVVAAVPARHPAVASGRTVAVGLAALIAGPLAVLAGLGAARQTTRTSHAHHQARYRTIVLALGPAEVTAHRLTRFGRRLGPALERYPSSEVSYRSTDIAVETILTVDGIEWLVHGWYERDLRAALHSIDEPDDAREAS